MPAKLMKKSFTRSISKKWNSVTGKNNGKIGVDDNKPVIVESDNNNATTYETDVDGYGLLSVQQQPSPLDILKEEMSTPSPYYKGPPGAAMVSDTSSDDDGDSSADDDDDDDDAADKYGYGDASPDTEKAPQMPRRLSSRAEIGRRRSSITRQTPLNLNSADDIFNGDGDDDENLPFHPKRTPRRSSLKESCPVRAQRRRASIGICKDQRAQFIEVKLPMRRESIKRRRSIQFDEDVNIRSIQPTTSVTGADKKQLWFQDEEYSTIKKKTRALLEKVDSKGVVNGKKYCTRGLEKYMEDPRTREQEKYEAWDSVLMEQEMQRKLKIFDDESIGRFYKRTSVTSVAEAHSRATADAAEVASFYNKVQQSKEPQPQPQAPQEVSDNEEQQQTQRRRRGRRASIA